MEDRGSKRKGKRTREDDEEDYNLPLASTQEETPSFVRVLLVALNTCPFLKRTTRNITHEELQFGNWEPLLCKIFSEDLLPRLRSSNPGTLVGRSSPLGILGSGGQKLQLCVNIKMPTHLFSGEKIKGEGGSVINVFLIDLSNGSVVQTGPASAANLNVVVLEGDFNDEISDGWEHDFFTSRQVKGREGKRPLLVGTVQVKLEGGVGILGDLEFTDNSSWTRSKHFRLGFVLASGFFEGIRVMEGKTNPFRVLHQRGKTYEKRCIPALHDEVWRLKNIAKDGILHKSLVKAKIRTVEDLLRLHAKDPQILRTILGKGMTDRMWETTITHAMTFSPLGEKFYVYYTDGTKSSGVIFNHIHEPLGFITDRQFAPLQSLDQTQKKSRVNKAYENWDQVVECDEQCLSSIITSKEIQDCPAEQAYSINHNITPTQTGHTFQSVHQIQTHYTSVPQQLLEPPLSSSDPVKLSLQYDWSWVDEMLESDKFNIDDGNGHNMVSGTPFSDSNGDYFDLQFEVEPRPAYRRTVKAVVGWLKIKAALKWGMVVRRAAKKRAKLSESDLN